MLIIGEKISASNRSVGEAVANRDRRFIEDLARTQAVGADFIDLNAGSGHGAEEHKDMEWLVEVVQEATDKPLTIDSDSPGVIEVALGKYRGDSVMINSVSAEPERLESIGRLAAERQALLVALAMGAEGIPNDVEGRLAACGQVMAHLTRLGLGEGQVLFDPLVLPISVDAGQGMVTLKTIEAIKSRYPEAMTVMGLSNISFGLPRRKLINRAFLLMAAYAGLDAVIMDPLDAKMMTFVKVAEMLTGKDPSHRGYIRAHRKGMLVD